MRHTLTSQECTTEDIKYDIYVLELDSEIVNIGIEKTNFTNLELSNEICINLNKKDLHSLIGTLLHVQAKMKGGKNG